MRQYPLNILSSDSDKVNSQQQFNANWSSVLKVEALGFGLMIVFTWLSELLMIPHYIFGEAFSPNWKRAVLRTVVVLAIWAWVHWVTRRLINRLRYLEEFLRVCAWCRKMCHEDKWLTTEEYFNSKFETQTTHGVCPECLAKHLKEAEKQEASPVHTG